MKRSEFKKRMQSLKSYREQNPDKGYWDWKVEQFQDGGELSDDEKIIINRAWAKKVLRDAQAAIEMERGTRQIEPMPQRSFSEQLEDSERRREQARRESGIEGLKNIVRGFNRTAGTAASLASLIAGGGWALTRLLSGNRATSLGRVLAPGVIPANTADTAADAVDFVVDPSLSGAAEVGTGIVLGKWKNFGSKARQATELAGQSLNVNNAIESYFEGGETNEGGEVPPMWLQEPYQGPTYNQVLESLKKDDPTAYNRLAEARARERNPTSEIVRYVDANGNIATASSVQGLQPVVTPEDLPGIGDAAEVYNIGKDFVEGNYGSAAAGLGLLAIPGGAAGKIYRKGRRIAQDLDLSYKSSSGANPKNIFANIALMDPEHYGAITGARKLIVPDKVKQIIESNVFSRKNIDYNLEKLYDRIYSVKPSAFDNPNFIGNAIKGSTINISNEYLSELNRVLPHEIRHRIDFDNPLTDKEKEVLFSAYDEDFANNQMVRHLVPDNYDVNMDAVTTNLDSRLQLLGLHSTAPLHIQNTIIDKSTDKAIFNSVRESNGYGEAYIKYLTENNLLTTERANKLREAMKYVGVGLPFAFFINQEEPQQYEKGGKVPPDNSPARVNPITNRPLANGAITPILNLEGAANFTPVGDVLSIRDAYVAAKNKDLLGLGLAGLGVVPFIPTVNRKATQDLIDRAIKQSEKSKQVVDDFYTQRNNVYESMIENEDAFRRAARADKQAGTNYVGTYGQAIRDYLRDPSQYNDDLPMMLFDRDLYGTNIKMQVDPSRPGYITVNPRYKDPDELDDAFKRINPGLVRHEMGHQTDLKAGLQYTDRLADPSKFVSDEKLKEMFPKTHSRLKSTVLNKGSEIKSYMNEFREFLMGERKWEPKESVKSFRRKLDEYSKQFPTLRMIFDSYKSKSDFVKDYNMVPLTDAGTNQNLV